MPNWLESASCTDLLQKALAAGCMPIRRCYLGAYMPLQHFSAHDARQSPDPLLGSAQMLKWRESA
eukprot:2286865-Rhodomonas_salina.1